MPNIGFWAVAGASAPVVAGSFDLLETALVSSAVASVTFDVSTYAALGYKHLQLRWAFRDTSSNLYAGMGIRFNSDSSSSYSRHRIYGGDTSVTSDADTSTNTLFISSQVGGGAATGIFSAAIVDFVDVFSTTKNKTIRGLAGRLPGGSQRFVSFHSGAYLKTDAVTSITLTPDASNAAIGSRFSIYGLKGA